TWASKTAGNFIRNDHVPGFMRRWLDAEAGAEDGVGRRMRDMFKAGTRARDPLELARAISQRVSREIAAGNPKVFQELAPLFASFVDAIGPLREPDESAYQRFAAQLIPGPTPHGGQDGLGRAFRSYYDAKFAPDKRLAAQHIFYANATIGLHEQTRLQPNI